MVRKIVHRLIDDLDGREIPDDDDGGTVQFSFQGSDYQIDLSAANLAKFEKSLQPYVDAAVKLRGPRSPRSTDTLSISRQPSGAVRQWARLNGYEVAARGRIGVKLMKAFKEAHSTDALQSKL